MERRLYLICYDIASPSRWRRVHRLLAGYRVEGQKSVFECLLTAGELRTVVEQLMSLMDCEEDRVHLVRLDPRFPTQGWGLARMHAVGQALRVL